MTLREHIEGWGLVVPRDLPGEVVELGPKLGCTSRACSHGNHDPASPYIRWTPPTGGAQLTLVGSDWDGRTGEAYYLLRLPDSVQWLRVDKALHYWDRIRLISSEDVPEYILARLATEAGD